MASAAASGSSSNHLHGSSSGSSFMVPDMPYIVLMDQNASLGSTGESQFGIIGSGHASSQGSSIPFNSSSNPQQNQQQLQSSSNSSSRFLLSR
jgi:hypothetical protein